MLKKEAESCLPGCDPADGPGEYLKLGQLLAS